MKQFKLKSHDEYEIFVTLWDDVSAPKGVSQICHGLSDYAGMFDDLVATFVLQTIIVDTVALKATKTVADITATSSKKFSRINFSSESGSLKSILSPSSSLDTVTAHILVKHLHSVIQIAEPSPLVARDIAILHF